MKSFMATMYIEEAANSTGVPLQLPSGAWRTAEITRPPTGAEMSYEKQRPETCGKRPSPSGMEETPFSSRAFNSAPLTARVTAALLNGNTASTCPRVMRLLGGAAGQKPLPPPSSGHVMSARSPPEFWIAKSTA